MNLTVKKIEPIITLLIWSAIIFYFSNIPGLRSAYVDDLTDFILRKTAHIIEFALLTLLSYRVGRLLFNKKNNAMLGAVFYNILYAISDEIHQIYVVARQGKILDVGIDAIGIFIVAIFLLVIQRYTEKQSQ